MSISENIASDLLLEFEPVPLETLVARAEMLERIDNKYVVAWPRIQDFLTEMASDFDVLEINGSRSFTYDTRYFDGPDLQSYSDHLRDRRRRAKVRTRRYVHSGQCFLEVKLKDRCGATVKHRSARDPSKFAALDSEAASFVSTMHQKAYGTPLAHDLSPSLDVVYQRITFVAKQGGERLTLDGRIGFTSGGKRVNVPDENFIIETKSQNGNGVADKILRRLHQHPTRHCSKYCIGLSALHPGLKSNTFRPAYRKLLGALPPSSGPFARSEIL
jgi:hypothetical protein